MRIVKAKQKIKISAVMCSNCEYICISRYRHDFVTCICYRRSQELDEKYKGKKFNKNYSYTKKYREFIKGLTGIYIDGGNEYQRVGWYGNTRAIPIVMYKIIEKEVE